MAMAATTAFSMAALNAALPSGLSTRTSISARMTTGVSVRPSASVAVRSQMATRAAGFQAFAGLRNDNASHLRTGCNLSKRLQWLSKPCFARRFVRFSLGEGIQKKSVGVVKPAAEAKKEEEAPKVAVSAVRVKELRQATGAGMMECKKALAANDNDVQKATDYLRKKGLASADKKSGRIASEGLIGSYIHNGRIGVLVEVNSETDFAARSAQFKELVDNIGMQVAACPQVQYVSVEEIPAAFVEKEKEIEMGKEDLAKRPEAVRSKIVEGRVAKTLNELALLEQPYIRDDKILVRDYVKQTIAALGENIQVRRFARFNLGEGIEKRSTDFAAEVAAQTGAKA